MITETLPPLQTHLVEIPNHPFVRAIEILPTHGPFDERPNPGDPYLSGSQISLCRKCSVKNYFKYEDFVAHVIVSNNAPSKFVSPP